MSDAGFRALVSGRVQGVGFRAWTRHEATALDVRGHAVNLPDGRVEVVAEGARSACQALVDAMRGDGPPGSVSSVEVTWGEPSGATTFTAG